MAHLHGLEKYSEELAPGLSEPINALASLELETGCGM